MKCRSRSQSGHGLLLRPLLHAISAQSIIISEMSFKWSSSRARDRPSAATTTTTSRAHRHCPASRRRDSESGHCHGQLRQTSICRLGYLTGAVVELFNRVFTCTSVEKIRDVGRNPGVVLGRSTAIWRSVATAADADIVSV